MKTLVIVESPAKAKTIGSFLNSKNYKVIASMGHIRNLPKSTLGIDVEKDFEPKYIVPKEKIKFVNALKKEVKDFDKIILASDEDREGEAISWHLKEALKIKEDDYQRIAFHEITPEAINHAIENPRKIDENMVLSQQARRILDRLVGYKLSPFLWKKLFKGLSAGRVQTPALRMIVEREREIEAFKSSEYWSVDGLFTKNKDSFIGNLFKIDGQALDKLYFKKESDVLELKELLTNKEAEIESIKIDMSSKKPYPPFTTSTLQQSAYQVYHYTAKRTMMVAQKLYEGINIKGKHIGLITYMRTDSLNLSQTAINNARDFISSSFGPTYLPSKPNIYKSKSKLAQEAHEAIRATNVQLTPESIKEYLTTDEFKLYDLIWKRFVTCQMKDALIEKQSIVAVSEQKNKKYYFKTDLQIIKFNGFLKITPIMENDSELGIKKGDKVNTKDIILKQHFTEPPARYNDASLIKTLEKFGIGRPSTYAGIVSILIDRGYVNYNEGHAFIPTDIGFKTNDMLVENFSTIADYELTKTMEDELDKIAENKINWVKVIRDFYVPFEKNLAEKYEQIVKVDLTDNEVSTEVCPECGSTLIIKMSRFGKFLACPGFPKCKYTKSIDELKLPCPKCKTGNIVRKRTKRGKSVYGCDQYPKCDFIINQKPLDEKCPKCGYPLINKNKKIKKCSNKDCTYDSSVTTDIQ
jgi:DNA topoisomerase I